MHDGPAGGHVPGRFGRRSLAALAAAAPLLAASSADRAGAQPTGRAARSVPPARRSIDVAELLRTSASPADAIENAFALLPPDGGELVLGPGVWALDRPLVLDGKPLRLRGAGNGITIMASMHAGCVLSVTQPAIEDLAHEVSLADLTIRALAPGASACAFALHYPIVPSWPLPTVTIENVSILGALGGTAASHFTTGIALTGCWQPRLRRVSFCGPGFEHADRPHTAFLALDRCFELVANDCEIYYAGCAVRQVGFCEGINLCNPIVVGCDWLLAQTDGWEGPLGVRLNGLWLQGGEVNTWRGGFRVARSVSAFVTGTEFNRFLDSGAAGYVGFDLEDCQEWTVAAVKMNAAHAAATATAIRITASGRVQHGGSIEPTANSFTGIVLTGFATGCRLGPGTSRNMVHGILATTGASLTRIGGTALADLAFHDEGEGNALTWVTNHGWTAHAGRIVGFAGRHGQLLAEIANRDDAVAHLRLEPAPADAAPALRAAGEAPDIALLLAAQGGGAIELGSDTRPDRDDARALGSAGRRFTEAWLTRGAILAWDGEAARDIVPCRLGSAFVRALRPVSYRRDAGTAGLHHGFIPREVGRAGGLPDGDFLGHVPAAGARGAADGLVTSELIAPLVVAFQELDARLRVLEGEAAGRHAAATDPT